MQYDYKKELVNNIRSEYSNLAQKGFKDRHEWVEKVIHLELCKK